MPGHTRVVEHAIYTPVGTVVRQKPYRLPEAKRRAVSKEIQDMLSMGIIEESSSEWSSPIVLIPKPDGSLRFCIDFRKVNEISTFNAYPMSHIDELKTALRHVFFPSKPSQFSERSEGTPLVKSRYSSQIKNIFVYTKLLCESVGCSLPLAYNELKREISKFKPTFFPGKICPSRLLQANLDTIIGDLCLIVNASLKQGAFPSSLKLSFLLRCLKRMGWIRAIWTILDLSLLYHSWQRSQKEKCSHNFKNIVRARSCSMTISRASDLGGGQNSR